MAKGGSQPGTKSHSVLVFPVWSKEYKNNSNCWWWNSGAEPRFIHWGPTRHGIKLRHFFLFETVSCGTPRQKLRQNLWNEEKKYEVCINIVIYTQIYMRTRHWRGEMKQHSEEWKLLEERNLERRGESNWSTGWKKFAKPTNWCTMPSHAISKIREHGLMD